MTTTRAAAAALMAAALMAAALAGCSDGSDGRASDAPSAPASEHAVSWHSCPASDSAGSPASGVLRCGQLLVPLNYQQPRGRTISLALSELPATGPGSHRQGL